jgi:hypothetical protein
LFNKVTKYRILSPLPSFDQSNRLSSDLGLDESQCLGTVLVDVLLVRVGVVSVAAVGIGRVAVRLDDAGGGWRAREARRTSGEALVGAGANVVGQTGAVVGVAHEDGGLDGCEGVAGKGCAGSAAEGVVHDLATLVTVSVLFQNDICPENVETGFLLHHLSKD